MSEQEKAIAEAIQKITEFPVAEIRRDPMSFYPLMLPASPTDPNTAWMDVDAFNEAVQSVVEKKIQSILVESTPRDLLEFWRELRKSMDLYSVLEARRKQGHEIPIDANGLDRVTNCTIRKRLMHKLIETINSGEVQSAALDELTPYFRKVKYLNDVIGKTSRTADLPAHAAPKTLVSNNPLGQVFGDEEILFALESCAAGDRKEDFRAQCDALVAKVKDNAFVSPASAITADIKASPPELFAQQYVDCFTKAQREVGGGGDWFSDLSVTSDGGNLSEEARIERYIAENIRRNFQEKIRAIIAEKKAQERGEVQEYISPRENDPLYVALTDKFGAAFETLDYQRILNIYRAMETRFGELVDAYADYTRKAVAGENLPDMDPVENHVARVTLLSAMNGWIDMARKFNPAIAKAWAEDCAIGDDMQWISTPDDSATEIPSLAAVDEARETVPLRKFPRIMVNLIKFSKDRPDRNHPQGPTL